MHQLLLSIYNIPFFCPALSVHHQRSYRRQIPNSQLFLLLCRLPFLHPKQRFHLPGLLTLYQLPHRYLLLLLLYLLMPWKSPLALVLYVLMPWNCPLVHLLHILLPWKRTLLLVFQFLWLPHLLLSLRHSSSSNLHLYPCC